MLVMAVYLFIAKRLGAFEALWWSRAGPASRLRVWSALVVLFLLIPIVLIGVYAFNKTNVQGWPITRFSTRWFGRRVARTRRFATRSGSPCGSRSSRPRSPSCSARRAAFAVHRFHFFGREAFSFILFLPIALPGIVTGMALNSFYATGNIQLSLWTIVIAHATFCIVIVYNNAIARLRRTPGSLVEASMDLGADGWQTFRYVILPVISTALVSGGLLAFALSFDEVIVTYFTAGPATRCRSGSSATSAQGPSSRRSTWSCSSVILADARPGVHLGAADPRHGRAPAR